VDKYFDQKRSKSFVNIIDRLRMLSDTHSNPRVTSLLKNTLEFKETSWNAGSQGSSYAGGDGGHTHKPGSRGVYLDIWYPPGSVHHQNSNPGPPPQVPAPAPVTGPASAPVANVAANNFAAR